jgi:hypothetical protein
MVFPDRPFFAQQGLLFNLDRFYRTVLSSLPAAFSKVLWNFIYLGTGLVIIHFENLWAGLRTKPASDTGLFINRCLHSFFSFQFFWFLYPVILLFIIIFPKSILSLKKHNLQEEMDSLKATLGSVSSETFSLMTERTF